MAVESGHSHVWPIKASGMSPALQGQAGLHYQNPPDLLAAWPNGSHSILLATVYFCLPPNDWKLYNAISSHRTTCSETHGYCCYVHCQKINTKECLQISTPNGSSTEQLCQKWCNLQLVGLLERFLLKSFRENRLNLINKQS